MRNWLYSPFVIKIKLKRIYLLGLLLLAVIVVGILLANKGSNRVTVPEIIGMTQAEAEYTLEASGLKSKLLDYRISDYTEKGKVIMQSPTIGSVVDKNSIVQIQVSKGKE
jgi:eukaryotic-like serine/threonine-protein kinase